MNEPRPSFWLAVLAGVAGGAAAGAADVIVTLLRGVGGVTGMHALRLLMIGIGAAGLAGAALALVARMLAGWVKGSPQRGAMLAAVLLGGPLVVYDAFVLFRGPQAARIPAHPVISVVL